MVTLPRDHEQIPRYFANNRITIYFVEVNNTNDDKQEAGTGIHCNRLNYHLSLQKNELIIRSPSPCMAVYASYGHVWPCISHVSVRACMAMYQPVSTQERIHKKTVILKSAIK